MEICTDKDALYPFLSQNKELNLYSLADLDDFFWPFTTYFVERHNGQIVAVLVKYQTNELPVIMALGDNLSAITTLAKKVIPLLGTRVYAHISYGCEQPFLEAYQCTYHESQQRMILRRTDSVKREETGIQSFGLESKQRLIDFFNHAYPSNWFDHRMLEIMPFKGAVMNHQLVSIAGIHAFSKPFNVAALGNITTHPDFRGQGLGMRATSTMTHELLNHVDLIGLNVHSENTAAKRCYEKVGFEVAYEFSEMMLEAR